MKKKNGIYFEELVELIERSIDKNAKIERDVQMPILNSPSGKKTQCDIVITKGIPPRMTKTIIEVQDRDSKVKPNDFRGWIEKLNEVDAQHLICVSRQKFPESIIEKASLSGNKISLINLMDISIDKIPLDFFKFKFVNCDFQIKSWKIKKIIVNKHLGIPKRIKELFLSKKIKVNEKVFSYDNNELFSFFKLAQDSVKKINTSNIRTSIFESKLEDRPCLNILHNKSFIPIGVNFEFDYTNITKNIPASLLSYEENDFGVLAWALKSSITINNSLVEMKIPIIPKNGKYQIGGMKISSTEDIPLSIEMKVEKGKN